MIKIIIQNILFSVVIVLSSCATSMTPIAVNNTLPTLTVSKFVSQIQAEEDFIANRCKYLVKGRKYKAPMGLTVKEDLKYGARGIDEWVKLDGGNAYVLTNYEWIAVGDSGATQLHIEFDTMLYE